jgi:hypothetical protein
MYVRFISWLTMAIAAAFLVVATAAFGLSTVQWLAFGFGIGTLAVSIGLGVRYRRRLPTVIPAVLGAIVSAWTVVASLVFAPTTVQPLALAGGLAIAVLAIIGLRSNELSSEWVVQSLEVGKGSANPTTPRHSRGANRCQWSPPRGVRCDRGRKAGGRRSHLSG